MSCFVSAGGLWWPANVHAERLLVPGGCVDIFRHLYKAKPTRSGACLQNGELLSAIFEGVTGYILVPIFFWQHRQQHHQRHQPNYHNHPDNRVKWGNAQPLPLLSVSSLSCPHLVSLTFITGTSTAFILTWCDTSKWMYATTWIWHFIKLKREFWSWALPLSDDHYELSCDVGPDVSHLVEDSVLFWSSVKVWLLVLSVRRRLKKC